MPMSHVSVAYSQCLMSNLRKPHVTCCSLIRRMSHLNNDHVTLLREFLKHFTMSILEINTNHRPPFLCHFLTLPLSACLPSRLQKSVIFPCVLLFMSVTCLSSLNVLCVSPSVALSVYLSFCLTQALIGLLCVCVNICVCLSVQCYLLSCLSLWFFFVISDLHSVCTYSLQCAYSVLLPVCLSVSLLISSSLSACVPAQVCLFVCLPVCFSSWWSVSFYLSSCLSLACLPLNTKHPNGKGYCICSWSIAHPLLPVLSM